MSSTLFLTIILIELGLFFYFFKQNRVQLINLLLIALGGYFFVSMTICRREWSDFFSPNRIDTFLTLFALMPCLILVCMRQTLSFLGSLKKLISFNNLCYLLFVFIGLCFGFLRRIDKIDFSLTMHDLNRATPLFFILIGFGSMFILSLIILHIQYAYKSRQLFSYLGLIGVFILLFGFVAFYFSKTHAFHLHHYAVFLLFVFLFRFKPRWSTYMQALFLGGYIEGVSSWNYAPLFIPV